MNLFIAQPMRGRPHTEVVTERAKAIADAITVLGKPVEPLYSLFWVSSKLSPLYGLSKAIELLERADVVYFVPGWELSSECRILHAVAQEYGIQIIESLFREEAHDE